MLNIRYALRMLFRTPGVTAVACLSLALGIGANSAIFTLFHQILLRSLPVQEPHRLVNLSAPGPKPGSQSCSDIGPCEDVFSYPMFRDLEHEQTVFTGIAAHRGFGANLAYRGQTLSGQGLLVSGSYFPVLGLEPALGRLLGPGDDRAPGGDPVVVLSYEYWRTRFDRSPAVLNDALTVNGQALTIVGVAPRGFGGTTAGSRPQVFVPITLRGLMAPGWEGFDERQDYWIYLFARLKPGVALERAAAAINVPYRAIVNDVEAPLQDGMSPPTMVQFRAKTVELAAGGRGQSELHGNARAPLLLLLGLTGLVLLIACANVANLLLARAAGRAGEMAVRLSIGAARRQLVGQLLTESCLLGVLAGAGGIVVAGWTLGLIASLLPAQVAETMSFTIDRATLWFTAALALGTGVLFGLVPALQSTRHDLVAALKGQAAQASGARAAARLRTTLVTAQIALAMTLLVSAGLFARSLANVGRVDLGLRSDHLVAFRVSPELNAYTPVQSHALFARLEEELAAVPGVAAVAGSMVPLISGNNWSSSISVEGFTADVDADRHASYNEIGPGFFRTLGIPLVAGREFTAADGPGAPKVAIVNQAFARKFGLGRDAVGRRMAPGMGNAVKLDIEIVGLVADAKYSEVKKEVPPQFFTPYRQDDELGSLTFYVRTGLAPEHVLASLGGVVRRLDRSLPVENLQTMDAQVRENVFVDRLIGSFSTAFALLATLLAAIGLYGVLAYTVAQRTREIGLRMALGADSGRVQRMVLGQVALMTLAGAAAGIPAALGLARLARSLLFGLEGHDPAVLAGAIAVLVLVALTSGAIPATRASRIDPMRALRYE
jgi:predicted permease